MEICRVATAGTMESSDIMITLEPGKGIEIELSSTVQKQFGNAIRATIVRTFHEMGVENAKATVVDKGALDCVVIARTRTAVHRAAGNDDYHWGGQGE